MVKYVTKMVNAMKKKPTQTLLMISIILVFILIVKVLSRDERVEKLDFFFGMGEETNSSSSSTVNGSDSSEDDSDEETPEETHDKSVDYSDEETPEETHDKSVDDSDSSEDGSTGSGSTGRGSTGRGSTGSGSTGRGSTGRGSTGRGSTGRGSTGRGSTGRGSTGSGSTGSLNVILKILSKSTNRFLQFEYITLFDKEGLVIPYTISTSIVEPLTVSGNHVSIDLLMFSHATGSHDPYWSNNHYAIGDTITLTHTSQSVVDKVEIRYFRKNRSVNMEVEIDDVKKNINAAKVQTLLFTNLVE